MTDGASDARLRGPIVVGALGGSGTRALAAPLDALGVYTGARRNKAHDNLWFTLLGKRPHWLPQRLTGDRPSADIVRALRVMEAVMTGVELDRDQLGLLAEAAADMAAYGHDGRGANAGRPAFKLAASAIGRPPPDDRAWWGWKEPNSHLVLPELVATFEDLRYVHVLRHPLDMAFSGNVMQMRIWGATFGIPEPDDERDVPNAQLRWWLLSTERAMEAGRALGDRFRLLHFEDLCADPVAELRGLCDAFGLEVTPERLAAAAELVTTPPSTGRWREQDLDRLDPGLVAAAGEHGFAVPEGRTSGLPPWRGGLRTLRSRRTR